METLTNEQLESYSDIPTSEIEIDLHDSQREMESFEKELSVLRSDPVRNRLEIYFREGKVIQRQELINKLNQILNYRKNK